MNIIYLALTIRIYDVPICVSGLVSTCIFRFFLASSFISFRIILINFVTLLSRVHVIPEWKHDGSLYTYIKKIKHRVTKFTKFFLNYIINRNLQLHVLIYFINCFSRFGVECKIINNILIVFSRAFAVYSDWHYQNCNF